MRSQTTPSDDLRLAPRYGITEAAHYLKMPSSTLRAWTVGQDYERREGRVVFQPVIKRPQAKRKMLSFVNLVEAHVLLALCRDHRVRLQEVRKALAYIRKNLKHLGPHPLAHGSFLTDGRSLLVEHYGQLINASQAGQVELRELISIYLKRVEHDASGLPHKLYPFSRTALSSESQTLEDQPRIVVINPFVSFGRPALLGAGVPTEIIQERFNAGETLNDIAEDYGCEVREVEEAIRYERTTRAA